MKITGNENLTYAEIDLPVSKSECNRALILSALFEKNVQVSVVSDAKDSIILSEALKDSSEKINVQDAGTAMRFLTAFYAIQGRKVLLEGSVRMYERPIGPLVDALRSLGANIHYAGKEGYPPLMFSGEPIHQNNRNITVPGGISSQYISALLMIAPLLPLGMELTIEGLVLSRPYIDLTISMLRDCGIECQWQGNTVVVEPQHPEPCVLLPSADWSAASYWYSYVMLSNEGSLLLKNLKEGSFQGDKQIANIMEKVGVVTEYTPEGAHIRQKGLKKYSEEAIDFSDFPDLAQTVIPAFAATNQPCRFTGLQSLRIKETDRIKALQNELKKFNVELVEEEDNIFGLRGIFSPVINSIETYRDHRMAMGFAPLVTRTKALFIQEPKVVEKSYPRYWEQMSKTGCKIEG